MLMAGIATTATAQTVRNTTKARLTPEQRADMQANKMTRTLNLTTAQKQQVYNLNLRMARERTLTRISIADAIKQRDVAYQGILTPAQFTQYKQLQNARLTAAPQRAVARNKGEIKK